METVAAETVDQIEELAYDWLTETGAPGASLVITNDTEELHATGVGARDLASNAPATPDTLYGVASVTKSVTALAVLQQVEAGAIALEDPIDAHTEVAFEGAGEVTIHELLTHSSGLPSLGASAVLLGQLSGGENRAPGTVPLGDREDLLHLVSGAGTERDERSTGRFLYNNTAYTLLSWAVETAVGEPFPAYVQREILEPLGMDRATFDAAVYTEDDDHATPYRHTEDGYERASVPDRQLSYGPGGLMASPRALGRYLRYQLTGGLETTQLLAPELLDRAHTSHVETLPRYGDGYGYGWSIQEVAGERLVGHGGSLLSSSAAVGFLPERAVGIAIGCAGQPPIHPTTVLEGIAAVLVGASPTVVPEIAYRERVDRLTGEYASHRGVATATVTDEDGTLSVSITAGTIDSEYRLVPEDPTLESYAFVTPDAGRQSPVEFVDTGDGIDLFLDRYRLHKQ